MNFISVMAVTEEVARERASNQTGYAPETIGCVSLVVEEDDNSRQHLYIFETSQDVTTHPSYAEATLSEFVDLNGLNDGPVLQIGREVTVGG